MDVGSREDQETANVSGEKGHEYWHSLTQSKVFQALQWKQTIWKALFDIIASKWGMASFINEHKVKDGHQKPRDTLLYLKLCFHLEWPVLCTFSLLLVDLMFRFRFCSHTQLWVTFPGNNFSFFFWSLLKFSHLDSLPSACLWVLSKLYLVICLQIFF